MNCKQSRVERNQMPLTRKLSLAAALALLNPLAIAADLQNLDVASLLAGGCDLSRGRSTGTCARRAR